MWKTPKLDDTFLLHWESKIHAKLLVTFAIECLIMPIGFILSGFDFKAYMIASLPLALTFGAINYVSTVIVPSKQRSIQSTEKQTYQYQK